MTHLNEDFDIEDYVLKHYNGMDESVLPDSITSIGTGAFNRCPAFQQRDISE